MGQPSRPLATTSRTIYNSYTIRHHPREKEHTYKKPRRYFAIIQISCLLKDDVQSLLERKKHNHKASFSNKKQHSPLASFERQEGCDIRTQLPKSKKLSPKSNRQQQPKQHPLPQHTPFSYPKEGLEICNNKTHTTTKKVFIKKFRLTSNKLLKIFCNSAKEYTYLKSRE